MHLSINVDTICEQHYLTLSLVVEVQIARKTLKAYCVDSLSIEDQSLFNSNLENVSTISVTSEVVLAY